MVLLAELAKIPVLDHLPPQSVVWNNPALQPAPVNPFLPLVGAYVQSFSQGMLGKPVLAHARIRSQPVQHGSNRSSRPSQQESNFTERARCDQVEEPLLLRFRPLPVAAR